KYRSLKASSPIRITGFPWISDGTHIVSIQGTTLIAPVMVRATGERKGEEQSEGEIHCVAYHTNL
ncbi:MAG: hypothetical protein LBP88_09135, partial [Treponema sp.]|nr:hypothetical protein [Treponema sp.]